MRSSKSKEQRSRYSTLRRRRHIRDNFIRLTIRSLVWIGVAVIYYYTFSLFFDTPYEHYIKNSTHKLKAEYETLAARYDTLEMVLHNTQERDQAIFKNLFGSTKPYDLEYDNSAQLNEYEQIFILPTRDIEAEFSNRVSKLEQGIQKIAQNSQRMIESVERVGNKGRNIPAIQPISNSELTKLTAAYGVCMHPFYRQLRMHQGVDYAVPSGTRVFATADGVVSKTAINNSTAGRTITIDHENGYQTVYNHLEATNVIRGQRVKRGEIIARSGNSGLSFSPHLHYEVIYNGMRVDPIHYYFLELSPEHYQQIMKIARSGMQSYD